MNLCNHCQADLVCEYVPSNRIYHCPSCGCPNSFGETGGGTGLSNLSRKSLLYAIGGIVLISVAIVLLVMRLPLPAGLAGPPSLLLGTVAIYYGIKAFLRSRYQPFSKRSKYEAISGIFGGGCFGVMLGGTASTILLIALVVQWSSEETKDVQRVTQAMQVTAKIDMPVSVELTPCFAKKSPIQKRIELWDDKSFSDSRNRFYLMWCNSIYTTQWGSSEANRDNLRRDSTRLISGNQAHRHAEEIDTSELEWEILDKPRNISKVRWRRVKEEGSKTEDVEFVIYQCLFDANHNTYCLTFFSKLPDPDVSESEIQSTFKSFKPIGAGW